MNFRTSRLGAMATVALLASTSLGFAATFSDVDTNGDGVLTEQEFVDALGPHHGIIAYRQYNTSEEPVIVEVEEIVQATDAEGNLLFEQGDPIMETVIDAEGNEVLVQATDAEGNLLFEQGDPIMETVITEVEIEGVTVDEIRRSERGFERSNEGKARSYANKQNAAENKANAGSRSSASSTSNNGKNGSKGKNK